MNWSPRLMAFFFCGLQHANELGAGLHLILALHGRQPLDGSLGRRQQAGHVGTRALQQCLGAVVLLEHGHEQVHGLDISVVIAQRNALGIAQGFLELGGEFVETHGPYPPNCRALEAVCA
jgi:hypothetical protein